MNVITLSCGGRGDAFPWQNFHIQQQVRASPSKFSEQYFFNLKFEEENGQIVVYWIGKYLCQNTMKFPTKFLNIWFKFSEPATNEDLTSCSIFSENNFFNLNFAIENGRAAIVITHWTGESSYPGVMNFLPWFRKYWKKFWHPTTGQIFPSEILWQVFLQLEFCSRKWSSSYALNWRTLFLSGCNKSPTMVLKISKTFLHPATKARPTISKFLRKYFSNFHFEVRMR